MTQSRDYNSEPSAERPADAMKDAGVVAGTDCTVEKFDNYKLRTDGGQQFPKNRP